MDDDFGPDIDFAAVATIDPIPAPRNVSTNPPTTNTTPRPGPLPKIQQPTPQPLPSRSAPAAILVSPRQKGNPILSAIRALPWEYGDIPADYVLGHTTCALFLSLKYHRLHPEYIYGRVRSLGGKYRLRVLLAMVDIGNHEESLRELAKTALVNHLTLVLCWSAAEAAHYLELYKTYEHASPASIRAHQATSYSEKLIEFITVPRSINKTDAVGLVSAFGSLRAAINARPEEIGAIAGWGEKKVERWCGTVRESFRVRKTAKRGIGGSPGMLKREESLRRGTDLPGENGVGQQQPSSTMGNSISVPEEAQPLPTTTASSSSNPPPPSRAPKRPADPITWDPDDDNDDDDALILAAAAAELSPSTTTQPATATSSTRARDATAGMSDGMRDALEKLRKE